MIGVAADFCVRWTIDGLLTLDFNVSVPSKLTCGIVGQIEEVVAEKFAGLLIPVSL